MAEVTEAKILQTKNSEGAHRGLEDAIATSSSICFIDGPRCQLIYRGYSINELAFKASYEEVAFLLLFGKLPKRAELQEFKERLASSRRCPEKLLERMKTIPPKTHPMVVLRSLVSALAFFENDSENNSYDENLSRAISLTAQIPTLVAAWDRVRNGKEFIAPDPKLTHAENFLMMLTGKTPDPLFAQALDLYLVMLADHELNASTFTCRVIASTLSDYYSAITGAIGALKGPLHGGANEQVIKMILEIGQPEKVDGYLQNAFAAKKKIMGFGHRVYKVSDPRSPLLREMAKKVCEKTGNKKIFEISEKIEKLVTETKKLPSNVDFYSASLLYCIGIPVDLFTPMFVVARICGWSAHYLEQIADNRLLRPRAHYTGPLDLPYKALSER